MAGQLCVWRRRRPASFEEPRDPRTLCPEGDFSLKPSSPDRAISVKSQAPRSSVSKHSLLQVVGAPKGTAGLRDDEGGRAKAAQSQDRGTWRAR